MTVAFRPPEIALPSTAPDDPRVGQLLGRGLAGRHSARAVIIGFPTDEGVRRNGGRPGAAAAPPRSAACSTGSRPTPPTRSPSSSCCATPSTSGDLVTSSDLEADQQRLGDVVADVLAAGAFPIILGGGHETAFGHFLGYVKAGRAVTLLNWDAHADVREPLDDRGHSGSPFRQALLHPSSLARRYVVAGLLPHSVAAAHLAFVRSRKGDAVWRAALTPPACGPLQGAARAGAGQLRHRRRRPGLRPGRQRAGGRRPADPTSGWRRPSRPGRSHAVTSFDLVETNPAFDRDHQTTRLAALTVWSLLRGLAGAQAPVSGERRA